jgi:23S rRNA pseudouridine2605 synthase
MQKPNQHHNQSESARIAKYLARGGLCSRREAEKWIAEGRVRLNGRILDTPAITVTPTDHIEVDGKPLPGHERTRLWLFHKPAGLVTTSRDPEGRPTVFSVLPPEMPRVMTIGRLDMATEGLLLLTNDGGLARVLELPDTGWLRRYRVRAHGKVTQETLDQLKDGIAVEGILYGPIEAEIDRVQGSNVWLLMGLREGKNREIKKVLSAIGLTVNRLIRISFGPFQLADMRPGEIREIRGRTLRDQLGHRLISAAGANFDLPIVNHIERQPKDPPAKPEKPRKARGENDRQANKRTSRPNEDARADNPDKNTGRRKSAAGKDNMTRQTPGRKGMPVKGRPGKNRDANRRG